MSDNPESEQSWSSRVFKEHTIDSVEAERRWSYFKRVPVQAFVFGIGALEMAIALLTGITFGIGFHAWGYIPLASYLVYIPLDYLFWVVFLPTYLALSRGHEFWHVILLLNLLGFCFHPIWVAALIWCYLPKRSPVFNVTWTLVLAWVWPRIVQWGSRFVMLLLLLGFAYSVSGWPKDPSAVQPQVTAEDFKGIPYPHK